MTRIEAINEEKSGTKNTVKMGEFAIHKSE